MARILPQVEWLFLATLLSACASPAPADSASMNPSIRIQYAGVPVDDQAKALAFYTEVLGFEVKTDIPVGGDFRWLTVTSPAGVADLEFLLEPNAHPATKAYQAALKKDGIPWTMFMVEDLDAVCAMLREKGVDFTMDATDAGTVKIAIFDDTCGNLIQLAEQLK
jgi:catechol 2,3-dioxygenase-like lactoylglutathione lyase family enzyme